MVASNSRSTDGELALGVSGSRTMSQGIENKSNTQFTRHEGLRRWMYTRVVRVVDVGAPADKSVQQSNSNSNDTVAGRRIYVKIRNNKGLVSPPACSPDEHQRTRGSEPKFPLKQWYRLRTGFRCSLFITMRIHQNPREFHRDYDEYLATRVNVFVVVTHGPSCVLMG